MKATAEHLIKQFYLEESRICQKEQTYQMDTEFFWPYDPIAVANQAEEFADILTEMSDR